MKYFPLVWTAVWRKPGETILIGLAVTAAFTLFGLMLGLHATYRHIIESSRNDRLEVDPRFPLTTGLRLPIAMSDQIARIEGVTAVGAYFLLKGYYRDPHTAARVFAVDSSKPRAFGEFPISAGEWSTLHSTPNGVLVSRKAAQRLNLRIGDVFPLITSPGSRADGATHWEFPVLAIVPDDPKRVYGFILGNLSYVESARPPKDQGMVMAFRVAIHDAARGDDTSLEIDRLFANSGTPTITIPDRTSEENAVRSGTTMATVTLPVAGAGLFMILLLTANGIAQSVRERVPEFAVVQTIGFRAGAIAALVFAEAVIPCLLGSALGAGLAALLTHLPMRYLPPDLREVPTPTVSTAVFVLALAAAILLAFVSSAAPILKLRRLSVIDAFAVR